MVAGVIVLRNIPHGFYEQEMALYFKQFGRVTRIRLLRNKKTHKSKGIAFIEFADEEVAKIAAESMNNYLMFDHLMKCQFVPENKVPPQVFKFWNKKLRVTSVKSHKIKTNSEKTPEQELRSRKKKLKMIHKATDLLKSLGIEYECTIIRNNEEDIVNVKKENSSHASDSNDETASDTITPVKSKSSKKVTIFDFVPSLSERKRDTPKSARVYLRRSLPKFRLLRAAASARVSL